MQNHRHQNVVENCKGLRNKLQSEPAENVHRSINMLTLKRNNSLQIGDLLFHLHLLLDVGL